MTFIDKINLPKDLIYEIKSFYYDSQGYSFSERNYINELKKKNYFLNTRIKVELWYWKKQELSISWLKRSNIKSRCIFTGKEKNSYVGVYRSPSDEYAVFRTAIESNIIKQSFLK